MKSVSKKKEANSNHLQVFHKKVGKFQSVGRRFMLEAINGKLSRPLEIHRLQQKVTHCGIMAKPNNKHKQKEKHKQQISYFEKTFV